MLQKRLFIFCLFLLFPFISFSENLFVDYLDGELELKEGHDWSLLIIGEEVSVESTLRLSVDSYVEFSYGDFKVSLSKEGVYKASSLVDNLQRANKWGIKGAAFARLIRESEFDRKQSTVMGVRGNPQSSDEITWVDDDIEFLEEGKNLYDENLFEEAQEVLHEGSEWNGNNYNEILFYLALSEYELGNYNKMKESLYAMDPTSDVAFFSDYVLLKGNLLIENLDYQKAIDLFDTLLSGEAQDHTKQSVYMLSAFCSLQLNQTDDAKYRLNKAIALDPKSETGIQASDLLKNI